MATNMNMNLTRYPSVVVGTDGSSLAMPTVSRAALVARRDDADLVIVCAHSQMDRRTDAKTPSPK